MAAAQIAAAARGCSERGYYTAMKWRLSTGGRCKISLSCLSDEAVACRGMHHASSLLSHQHLTPLACAPLQMEVDHGVSVVTAWPGEQQGCKPERVQGSDGLQFPSRVRARGFCRQAGRQAGRPWLVCTGRAARALTWRSLQLTFTGPSTLLLAATPCSSVRRTARGCGCQSCSARLPSSAPAPRSSLA